MNKRSLLFVLLLMASFLFINMYLFDQPIANKEKSAVSQDSTQLNKDETQNQTKTDKSYNDYNKLEEYYVLENKYQQIVFSNIGGSIAEINLPFKSKNNNESVVRQIAFDRQIEISSPNNVNFPLNSYKKATITGVIVKKDPTLGGYTPLIRRSLKSKDGAITFKMPYRHYAMNLVSHKSNLDQIEYKVEEFTNDEIKFTANSNNQKITKTFKLNEKAPYTMELNIQIDNDSSDLYLTSGIPEVELMSGAYSPVLEYYYSIGNKNKINSIKLPKNEPNYINIQPIWISNSNGFFGIITDPIDNTISSKIEIGKIPGNEAPTRLTLINGKSNTYQEKNYPGYEILIPYKQSSETSNFRVYAGPYDTNILNTVDEVYLNKATGESPNFSKAIVLQGYLTFILEPFSKFLYLILNLFYNITKSWGLSIILLTLILRVVLFPLNNWSYKSNAKLQAISPKLKAIEEKFKKDPSRQRMEMAMLYKNEGANPFSGCLPMLIQIPFLMGMYDLLKSTFALRGASFVPGWIGNLTSPDILFSWSYSIPFFGTDFHLLPFILGGLMFVQQKMSAVSSDKKAILTESQKQMKNMSTIMTLFFIFMFYNMPSGLNIYWIFSTIFGMIQQYLITRKNIKLRIN